MLQEMSNLKLTKAEIVGKLSCQRDSYLKELDTEVISCEPEKEYFAIILKETILFPTGGGQPFDMGSLNFDGQEVKVFNVERIGSFPIHFTKLAIKPGQKVTIKLDWKRRFDHMQQHSGQHIISDLAEKLFSWKTFGWKMGQTTLSSFVEFDNVVPTPEDLDQLELAVNEFIQEAVTMQLEEVEMTSETRTDSIPQDIKNGIIRQIRFGEFSGPCCGTHVKTSAQIGGVKLLQLEKVRSGNSRVYFLCGSRIQKQMSITMKINQDLNKILSCPPEDFVDRVGKKLLQLKTLLKENKKLKQANNKDAGEA
jgi:misacylated tRNA(Ala) deacylase